MRSDRQFVTTLRLDGESWDWGLYREVESVLAADRAWRRIRGVVTLVDADGTINTSSIKEAEMRAGVSGGRPQSLTAQYRYRGGASAVLTVEAAASRTIAEVRFSSKSEVVARGLQSAVKERVRRQAEEHARSNAPNEPLPSKSLSGTVRLGRFLIHNPWPVGIASSIIGSIVIFPGDAIVAVLQACALLTTRSGRWRGGVRC